MLQYEFLKEFLPSLKQLGLKIYLETTAQGRALDKVIEYIDIVSMDFKLDSSAKIGDLYSKHDAFLEICKKHSKDTFAKLVFDETTEILK